MTQQPLLMATGAESREFRKMMFGVKAQILGKLVFLSTQFFVGKFLNGSTVLADHEAMAAFRSIQATPHEAAVGQHLMSQIKAAQQIQCAVDGNVV